MVALYKSSSVYLTKVRVGLGARTRTRPRIGPQKKDQEVGAWEPLLLVRAPRASASLSLTESISGTFQQELWRGQKSKAISNIKLALKYN